MGAANGILEIIGQIKCSKTISSLSVRQKFGQAPLRIEIAGSGVIQWFIDDVSLDST